MRAYTRQLLVFTLAGASIMTACGDEIPEDIDEATEAPSRMGGAALTWDEPDPVEVGGAIIGEVSAELEQRPAPGEWAIHSIHLRNGDSTLQFPDSHEVLDIGDELTVSLWVRADWDDGHCDSIDPEHPAWYKTLYDNGSKTATRLRFGVLCDRQTLFLANGQRVDETALPVGLDDGEPHHLVLRFDGDGVRVSVDGVEAGGLPVAPSPAGLVSLTIGNDAHGASPFIGLIGGLVVLRGLHPQDEIEALATIPTELWTDQRMLSRLAVRFHNASEGTRVRLTDPGLDPEGRWIDLAQENAQQFAVEAAAPELTDYAPHATYTATWTDTCSELAQRGGWTEPGCDRQVLAVLLSALWGETRVRLYEPVGKGRFERFGAADTLTLGRNTDGRLRFVTDDGHTLVQPKPQHQELPFSDTLGGSGGEANYELLNYAVDLRTLDLGVPDRTPRGAPVFAMLPMDVGHEYTQVAKIAVPFGVRLGRQTATCYGESFARELTTSTELTGELSELYSTQTQQTDTVAWEASYVISSLYRSDTNTSSLANHRELKEKHTELAKKLSSEFRQQIRCVDYEFYLAPSEARLHSSFVRRIEALRDLPPSRRAAAADALVADVGTHYANSITYGGLASLQVEVSETTTGLMKELARRQSTSTESLVGWNMHGGVELSGAVRGVNLKTGANGGKTHEKSKSSVSDDTVGSVKNTLEELKVTTTSWRTIGGTGAGTPDGWTAQGTQVPIHMQLRPISELLGAPFFTDPEIVFDVRKEVERAIVRHLGSATTNVSVLTSSQTWTYSEWGAECPHLDLSCDENAYLTCRDESGGQSMDAPELTQFCLKELDAVAADDACRSDSECSGDNVCSDDSVCSAPWREPEPEPVVEPEHWTATFGTDLPIENGTYTARQAATGRHLNGSGDLATGKIPQGAAPGWDFQVNGLLVYLKHEDTGRFLDAYVDDEYGAVTREWQDNPTQTWLLEPSGDGYTVRQAEKGRYLDAFESDNDDYAVVTRNKQDNNTQVWTFSSGSSRSGSFTIKQLSSSRSLATDDTSNHSALTKTKGPMWEVIVVGVTYSIGHANGQVLDAHQSLAKNYQATVSSADSSPSQYWAIVPVPNMDDFTIREVSNGQFLDAYVDDTYAVVTRTEQGDSSQRWALDPG